MADFPNNKYTSTYTGTEIDKAVASAKDTAEKLPTLQSTINAHIENENNPHSVTKAQVGLSNVDNTSDLAKPVSTATQTALNGKANTSGTYPNLTVGKATNADNATNATNATNAAKATKATQDASGNVITSTYATKNELNSGLNGKANTSGSYPNLTVGKATNADNATNATKADAIKQTDTRKTNELPTFYYNKAAAGQNFTFEFKESAAIGLTGQSIYCQLQTYAKWTDSTGGNITQVAVVDTNYFIRTSTGSTGWGAWEKMALSSEIITPATLASQLLSMVYPVGSIYMSTANTSPANFLGGTWVAWGSGRVPVGVNASDTDFNSVEKTGGEKTHTLTIAEMPSHSHSTNIELTTGSGSQFRLRDQGGNQFSSPPHTGKTGGGGAHNNLPPYITCYMWKRTA